MSRPSALAACLAAASLAVPAAAVAAPSAGARPAQLRTALTPAHGRHVLLVSVDGLHASDLSRYVGEHPGSALSRLSEQGTTYSGARSSFPSDSFPGLLALVTGGTPRSTGVYYDDSYDRSLYSPGSGCAGAPGTEVVYDESIDRDPSALGAGGGIDPAKLPLARTAAGCVPVYPHSFLRVNTIFNVARKAGLRTAWADKHPAYDLVNGPSGHGVDDLYTPEIAAGIGGTSITSTVPTTQAYDAIKVKAVLNQIHGRTSSGRPARVPAIFGLNFQAVSVAQKLPYAGSSDIGGYGPGGEDFTPQLEGAMAFVDGELAKLVTALDRRGLLASTEIIVTAKHGQSPTDPAEHVRVDPGTVPGLAAGVGASVAQATQDDVGLYWLTDQSRGEDVAAAVRADQQGADTAHVNRVFAGSELADLFVDPLTDPRVPDVVVQPQEGVVFSNSTKKVAEHGGGAPDDRDVALLVAAGPSARGGDDVYDRGEDQPSAAVVDEPVSTTQVAPSILRYLRLPTTALQAVRQEGTHPLPAA